MPISLSFFLTLCAVMWFWYGILMKDLCVAVSNNFTFLEFCRSLFFFVMFDNKIPNVLGILFGEKKDESRHKSIKDAKEKRNEPPQHSGFILQTNRSKSSKVLSNNRHQAMPRTCRSEICVAQVTQQQSLIDKESLRIAAEAVAAANQPSLYFEVWRDTMGGATLVVEPRHTGRPITSFCCFIFGPPLQLGSCEVVMLWDC